MPSWKPYIDDSELSFSFSRSSGPGGQNVNKVNSRATLCWVPNKSQCVPTAVIKRFLKKYLNRINQEGELKIHSDRYRDQKRNVTDCKKKLLEMLETVATPPKKRLPTKPSKASIEKRLQQKKSQSEKKKQRRQNFS